MRSRSIPKLRAGRRTQPRAAIPTRVEVHNRRRARVHAADGQKFDLVLFALPDSLTSVAGQSNLRLESYLFTTEAFARAGDLLASEGMFALYNTHSEQWVVDRMARTLRAVLMARLCQLGSTARFPRHAGGRPWPGSELPGGAQRPKQRGPSRSPMTDPSCMFESEASLLSTCALALGASWRLRAGGGALRRRHTGSTWRYPDLFLMGTAFLLLEAKSVSQFALWFGTTWSVIPSCFPVCFSRSWRPSSVSRRMTQPITLLYGLLLVSVAASWAIPAASFLLPCHRECWRCMPRHLHADLRGQPRFCGAISRMWRRLRRLSESICWVRSWVVSSSTTSLVTGYRTLAARGRLFVRRRGRQLEATARDASYLTSARLAPVEMSTTSGTARSTTPSITSG